MTIGRKGLVSSLLVATSVLAMSAEQVWAEEVTDAPAQLVNQEEASPQVEAETYQAAASLPVESSQLSSSQEQEDNQVRFHVQAPEADAGLGLWTWGDVAEESAKKGPWPAGASALSEAKRDHYGVYVDVPLAETKQEQVHFLINNTKGDNLSGDQTFEIIDPKAREVWIAKDYSQTLYEPVADNLLRINYQRADQNYDQKSVWVWGDVELTLSDWPRGLALKPAGRYGAYVDIPLKAGAQKLGFLLLDETKEGDAVKIQPKDYLLEQIKGGQQVFVREDEAHVYTNPYFVKDIRLIGAQQSSLQDLTLTFTNLDEAAQAEIQQQLQVLDEADQTVSIQEWNWQPERRQLDLKGDFQAASLPYRVTYGGVTLDAQKNWQFKDRLFAYDGPLGAQVLEAGRKVDLALWSPSADSVSILIYDKDNQDRLVAELDLDKQDKGVWRRTLVADAQLGIADYRGYFYQYKISRAGTESLVLDPYAKSLALWNSEEADKGPAYRVAKAAFVNPAEHGPQDLTYAKLDKYRGKQDAIIYEAHVRDFTSDPQLSLDGSFGTFRAFIKKLDYLQELGVTHIQLLPVLSYYFVNEAENQQRMLDYRSSGVNYNWGYDPQSYFALTGMYSERPQDPAERIAELKELVQAIHDRGMAVILDVVYNHTAKTAIFEDLEPNYYHFMDQDGTPRTSFGGGRLGTTHYMSRRILTDSIRYLLSEFKVDGFRFDMMGDHDAASIAEAYRLAKELNPQVLFLGEGWRTYTGDADSPQQAADQDWMKETDGVAVFSDDIRNSLKSGYPNEGAPAFLTTGPKKVTQIFQNLKAQPGNFEADQPTDVIQYIAAHDNLTLFDVIAQSIHKDPTDAASEQEIHQRLRLGNLMILTAQGIPFLHSGQEYGRTKQFRDPAYRQPVSEDRIPNKAHLLTKEDGSPFDYPYFIHDSYDSSDSINRFDWSKVEDGATHPLNLATKEYTKGLIQLRRALEVFRIGQKEAIEQRLRLVTIPGQNGVQEEDLVLGYELEAKNGDRYVVLVNADRQERSFAYAASSAPLVLVDGQRAGLEPLEHPVGVTLLDTEVRLAPLTATVLWIRKERPLEPVPPQVNPTEKQVEDLPADKPVSPTVVVSQSLLAVKPPVQEVSSAKPEPVVDSPLQLEQEPKSLPKTGSQASLWAEILGFLGVGASFWFEKKKRD
ncbi:pullulanase [Streptococcus danieliae]|uniref:pullulanase n=1 Tax=Streptococcus danieliae TaxID=747656 RepID=A0A7Z0M537_9STRE|nr:pullulanase [Streptococcus danieliae]MBF0698714.1 pullulanase [Streptococcus danieliae]NYS95891.1 pullulanase [Streptococcus danieliae]